MAYYYTRDHIGSVREMCSSTGTITSRMAYDPYGRTTLVSGTNLATKQYAGMYLHQPSGLNLTEYRAYDSNTGRWLSRDPEGEGGGIDLYDYVDDEPIDGRDPLGLEPKRDCLIQIIAGHFSNTAEPDGGLEQDIEKRTSRSGKFNPMPCGDALGYAGCGANGFNCQIPPPYAIPGMPKNCDHGLMDYIYGQGAPDQLPFALAQSYLKQAIEAAKLLAPTKCKGCCKSVTIKVTCLGAAMKKYGAPYCGYSVTIPCPNSQ